MMRLFKFAAMKKHFLLFLIFLMAIAMSVFIGIQVYWIKNSLQLRQANFRRSIDDAVNVALLNLETIEFSRRTTNSALAQSENNRPPHELPDPQNNSIQMAEQPGIETGIPALPGKRTEDITLKVTGSLPLSITENQSAGSSVRQQLMLNHVIRQMAGESEAKEIEKIVTSGLIDTLLHQELLARGITTDYEFGVFSPDRNKIVLEKTGRFHEELLFKGFSFPLFSGVGISSRDFLLIYFPQQSKYNIKSILGMMIISLLLVLTIISAFSYSVFTIIRQRKLSELKNDFINNMTHEFKTPISTISLACQALSDKDIARTKEMYNDYIHIIGDENHRLGEMAEKILQTAILEKGTLHLRCEEIDMHKLIADAIHKIAIQIEIRDGVINKSFGAEHQMLKADMVHLSNVIYNLLDNANKYSPRKPQITISTKDGEGGLFIYVQDKGMGISKANQKRIFEKLYRVPTGDVHNVKGFGLGLSYVKFIVEKHGGFIQVDSEPGKGSTFTVFLPYVIPDPDFQNNKRQTFIIELIRNQTMSVLKKFYYIRTNNSR